MPWSCIGALRYETSCIIKFQRMLRMRPNPPDSCGCRSISNTTKHYLPGATYLQHSGQWSGTLSITSTIGVIWYCYTPTQQQQHPQPYWIAIAWYTPSTVHTFTTMVQVVTQNSQQQEKLLCSLHLQTQHEKAGNILHDIQHATKAGYTSSYCSWELP